MQTGTVHILASAGLHVGILAGTLLLIGRSLTLPRKITLLLVIAALAFYAAVCGGRPSVVRAALMAGIFFGGIVLERLPDVATSLAVAALAVLGWQPSALVESGFQLTFLTVATLVFCMPAWNAVVERFIPLRRTLARRFLIWAIDLVGVSLLAQIGSAPIVAAAYNEISVTGLIANLLVVPLLFPMIPLALLALVLTAIVPAAGILLKPCGILAGWVIALVTHFGEAPGAFHAIAPPPIWEIILYYAALFAAAWWLRQRLGQGDGEEEGAVE